MTFGLTGLIIGGSAAVASDAGNLASVIQSATASENLLSLVTSPLVQVVAIGCLGFVSQMLMALLYTVETAAVGTLLQKATGILFSFTFQIFLYKVSLLPFSQLFFPLANSLIYNSQDIPSKYEVIGAGLIGSALLTQSIKNIVDRKK